jgi:hypothetical protein
VVVVLAAMVIVMTVLTVMTIALVSPMLFPPRAFAPSVASHSPETPTRPNRS